MSEPVSYPADPEDPLFDDAENEVPGFPEHGNDGNEVDVERTAKPEDFPPADYQEAGDGA